VDQDNKVETIQLDIPVAEEREGERERGRNGYGNRTVRKE
jgi:hypothetical protein